MLDTKLTKSLLRTTDNYIKALEKAKVITIRNLVNHFPRDYEDRTNVLDTFSLLNLKDKNTILVTLLSINTTKTGNNKLLTKAVIEDKNGFMSEAIWFNRRYLSNTLSAFTQKKILLS
jgi:ATP-dependent DNA helicase RecG